MNKRPLVQLLERCGNLERIDRELLAQLNFVQGGALAQAGEQPQLRRSQVDTGPGGEPFVQLPALLAAGEVREGAFDLAQRVVVVSGVEAVAHVGRLRRRLQRQLG